MRQIATCTLSLLLCLICRHASAQDIDKIINPAAVEDIEKVLSADAMRGRAVFTPDIERAADYIEARFKEAGLQTWNNSNSYRQPFVMVRVKPLSAGGTVDGQALPDGMVVVASSEAHLVVDENSGYEKAYIKAGANLGTEFLKYVGQDKKSWLVLVDTSFSKFAKRMSAYSGQGFKSPRNVVFVFTTKDPAHYHIEATQQIEESK